VEGDHQITQCRPIIQVTAARYTPLLEPTDDRGAKKDELQAEYKTQLQLARGKADAEREAKENYDRDLYQSVLATGDQTGWAPKPNQLMTETQFNSAKEKFADRVPGKAQDTDKSFQMFQNAYGDFKAAKGKLPTGAQSMLALSTHLSVKILRLAQESMPVAAQAAKQAVRQVYNPETEKVEEQ
jgi:hypothetical protein